MRLLSCLEYEQSFDASLATYFVFIAYQTPLSLGRCGGVDRMRTSRDTRYLDRYAGSFRVRYPIEGETRGCNFRRGWIYHRSTNVLLNSRLNQFCKHVAK
jgi:hypothetical protein